MSNHLDLDEQEQLDQIKHFWNKFGNLITWVLLAVLMAFAAWNGWQWWQRDQGLKAAGMYDELERSATSGDVDRAGKVSAELRDRYGRTVYAAQGALLAAKMQFDKGQLDAAKTTLGWVADNASETEYRVIARLRLAGLLSEQGQYDEALKQLGGDVPASFTGLVADRRGDVLQAKGQKAEAITAYEQAWKAMDPALEYRRLVEAKLTVLGAAPKDEAAPAAAAASGASQ